MNPKPTIEQAKNAYRDAASLMLNLFREDMESIEAILDSNREDMNNLLSGMIAIAAMVVMKAFEDEAVPALEGLVGYLAGLSEDEWKVVSSAAFLV